MLLCIYTLIFVFKLKYHTFNLKSILYLSTASKKPRDQCFITESCKKEQEEQKERKSHYITL